ncbi:hypothetical protein BDM02DRAFT_2078054 [Thelephora ganbajun]|uniref:Uncharacterized protein n=1 Tax=Thelephora ganbajun TaxID=370292 RepID=A0ACB6Z044_THEGA|nr:hypothetical protein BDM02DRAFT_2078054 [Thelephora ganbajun]
MVRSPRSRGPSVKASKYAELDDSCYVPSGAGGARGSSGRMTVNLERTEMARKFNDDEAEKRKRRKSAKLLGQQSTLFDGLTDLRPAMNGLNTGKQTVQLNSVVPAGPIINVPKDVMNSNLRSG